MFGFALDCLLTWDLLKRMVNSCQFLFDNSILSKQIWIFQSCWDSRGGSFGIFKTPLDINESDCWQYKCDIPIQCDITYTVQCDVTYTI